MTKAKVLFQVAFSTLFLMTGYELLKQAIFPGIGIWNSHLITIAFSSLAATGAAFLAFSKYRKMNERLNAEIDEHKRLQEEREKLIQELKSAQENLKVLKGYLHICSYCKRIYDDEQGWSQMETYISTHSEAEFSHGICPDCLKKETARYRLYEPIKDEIRP